LIYVFSPFAFSFVGVDGFLLLVGNVEGNSLVFLLGVFVALVILAGDLFPDDYIFKFLLNKININKKHHIYKLK